MKRTVKNFISIAAGIAALCIRGAAGFLRYASAVPAFVSVILGLAAFMCLACGIEEGFVPFLILGFLMSPFGITGTVISVLEKLEKKLKNFGKEE